MKLMLFEWMTGGGLWVDHASPGEAGDMLEQGKKMLTALARDSRSAGFDICLTADSRLDLTASIPDKVIPVSNGGELLKALKKLATSVDAILFVAPESDGCLLKVCEWLLPWADKWLCPDIDFVRLASDKTRTCDYLASYGLPAPEGGLLSRMSEQDSLVDWQGPLVVKPNRGAGSESIRIINDISELGKIITLDEWRVEKWIAGESVSVSVVAQAGKPHFFRPRGQLFDRQPIGSWVGSRFPLSHSIEERAGALARQVVSVLPETTGYFGIDMLIGDTFDAVVEINPRITLSYCDIGDEPGPASFIFASVPSPHLTALTRSDA